MATTTITKDNLETTITNNDIVLLDCWADWCGPCKQFGPIFEDVSTKHEDVVFGKLDTENEKELASSFGIRSIPTVMAFREGILLFSQPGLLPAEALEELVGKIKDLDMAEVRAEIEKEKAQA